MTTATENALAALDNYVMARTALKEVIEFDNGDISDTQRNLTNTRSEEFEQVQTMFTIIGSKIDDFQASYLDPTSSPHRDAVLSSFFEAASASGDNYRIFVADYVDKDDDSSVDSEATAVNPAENPADFDMDEKADDMRTAQHNNTTSQKEAAPRET